MAMTPTLQNGIFITGIDTNIGKTFISRLLADTLSKSTPATYMKPIQTGCTPNGKGEFLAPDFEYMLLGSIRRAEEYRTHVPYRFKPACSPHLASRLDGQEISFQTIRDCLGTLFRAGGVPSMVLVEGAGGVYTPLSPELFMIDLIAYLCLPVILVFSPKLGALNHTVLTLQALQQRSIRLAGVVMNDPYGLPEDFIYADNREFIRDIVKPVPFVHVPFTRQFHSDGPFISSATLRDVEDFCREIIR